MAAICSPGFIDAHCHLGMLADGLRYDDDDCNEISDPCTPNLRAIDGLYPMDYCFQEAREAGVTTVLTSPGQQQRHRRAGGGAENRGPLGG